jgi:threonine/homoserine/homoserine lactone efflux protein
MSEGRRANIWAVIGMICFAIAFLTIVLGVLFAVIR